MLINLICVGFKYICWGYIALNNVLLKLMRLLVGGKVAKKFLVFGFLGFCLFLLLGSLSVVNILFSGKAGSYDFYCLLTFPFEVVLVGFGLFGLFLVKKSWVMMQREDVRAKWVLLGGFGLIFLAGLFLDFVAFPRG